MNRFDKNNARSKYPFVEALKAFERGDAGEFEKIQKKIGIDLKTLTEILTARPNGENPRGYTNIGFWSYLLSDVLPFKIFTFRLKNCELKKLEPFNQRLNEALQKFSFVELLVGSRSQRELFIKLYLDYKLDCANPIFPIREMDDKDCLYIPLPNPNNPKFNTFTESLACKLNKKQLEIHDENMEGLSNLLKILAEMQYSLDFLNYLYLIPLTVKCGQKLISGVQAVHIDQEPDSQILTKVIKFAASGLVMPYHVQEMDYLRNIASLHSAVAAIMARNMSHNIGSHVLASISSVFPLDLNVCENQLFYKYTQARMDFIAQVSTEFPEWSYPGWFLKDLMRNFYRQKTLLDNIAKYEELKAYEWDDNIENIIIKVKDTKSKEYIIPSNNVGSFKDYLLSIPGGNIGQHAFYVVSENIIRNAAKHSWATLEQDSKEKKKNLVITIELEDEEYSEDIRFKIYDNVSLTSDEPELPHNCEKEDNLPLHQKINCKFLNSFIEEESGRLKREDWGIKEIKIGAGFLQKRKIPEIGRGGKDSLDIIKAVSVEDEEDGQKVYRLGYEFRIPKPKEFLIIGDLKAKKFNEAKKYSIYYEREYKEWMNLDYEFSILVDSKNALIEKILPSKNPERWDEEIEKLPYRLFVVTEEGPLMEEIEKNDVLRNRIVILSTSDFENYIKNGWEEFKITFYRKWLDEFIEKRKYDKRLHLNFEKAGENGAREKIIRNQLFGLYLIKYFDEKGIKIAYPSIKDAIKEAIKTNKELPGMSLKDLLVIKLKCRLVDDSEETIKETRDKAMESVLSLKEPSTVPGVLKREGEDTGLKEVLKDLDFEEGKESEGIVYSRHASMKAIKGRFKGVYIESMSGASTHFSIFTNLPDDKYLQKKIALQLIENGLIKMLIIDERVADFVFKDKEKKIRLEKANITAPTGEVKMKINGSEYKYRIKKERGKSFDLLENKEGYDVIIIHQGVLDKMTRDGVKINPAEFAKEMKKRIPFVIITSGRGEPASVPENAKFVPFFTIESLLLCDYHEKFILTQIIMNLKQRGQSGG